MHSLRAGLGFNPSAVPTGASQGVTATLLPPRSRISVLKDSRPGLQSSAVTGALGRQRGRPCPPSISRPAAPGLSSLWSGSEQYGGGRRSVIGRLGGTIFPPIDTNRSVDHRLSIWSK